MAVLCAVTDGATRGATVKRLVGDMMGRDETRKHLGLLVIGELGTQTDLSGVPNLQVARRAAWFPIFILSFSLEGPSLS